MCRHFAVLIATATVAAAAMLAATAVPQSPPSPSALPSSPHSVVLDVVVEDQAGHPVRGLKPENFRLTEAGVPQTLDHVEEHTSQSPPPPSPALPPLPPGTFTDYTLLPSGSTLNILLLDALNTTDNDRAFIRSQLQQYVKHANPNTRIAVFGLANHLILLQGFTSNPAVLRDVVERKLIPRSSAMTPRPGPPGPDQPHAPDPSLSAAAPTNSSPSAIEIAANLREFETELSSLETQLRAQYTLDAFNTLAHYLAGFPGRKNLLWFSASFPFNVLPNPSLAHPFDVADTDQDEFRETVNLLAKAQVAVFPIDARSLLSQPASNDTTPASPHHARHANPDLPKFTQTPAAEHAMMQELAASTGGRALYNPTNLTDAVTSAVAAGTDYYTLSYTPTHPTDDGSFRPIHIDTTGLPATPPLQLSYRHGYYTNARPNPAKPAASQDLSAPTPEQSRAEAYKQAAMTRGAPTPEDILFKVRVLPASTTTETAPAPNNQLSPNVPTKGPFRRYNIDYLSLPGELTFTQQPDGHRIAKVEFLAYVFDTEGRLLDATGKDISFEATPANIAKLLRSILRCHLELSVPDRAETFLRIAIRDVTTNKFGVIELPTSTLSSFPPATYAPAPASGRATPPQD